MTIRTLATAATLAACVCLPSVQAHDVWLLPSSTVLSKAGYITVDGASSNQTFHFNHRPLMMRDGPSITAPDGSTVAAENLLQGKLRTVFDVHLKQAGTYRLAVANSGIMASWKEGGETKRWRGTAEEFSAKVPVQAEDLSVREGSSRIETFVTVGEPTLPVPIGNGLELVPVTHPNDLYAGEEASFRFFVDGKPVAGVEVVIVRGGTRYRDQPEKVELVTDADGKVSFTWP
ncbi:MAG: DUF4198 domain-containing protein, partial [Ectothiorhodospiraceae bacterium]|nr:DUF4198 domain-containing protein [Ectothiorhodospiraceae bacterium]